MPSACETSCATLEMSDGSVVVYCAGAAYCDTKFENTSTNDCGYA